MTPDAFKIASIDASNRMIDMNCNEAVFRWEPLLLC